jgi:low affinity Fe/Cu permease
VKSVFERLAQFFTTWAGSTAATILAFLIIILWTVGGFHNEFSTDYQMYINTGTTIVTFLMVFLIQRTQNKNSLALQMKLNELIATSPASNRLLNLEDLSEEEIFELQRRYRILSEKIEGEDPNSFHSVEEVKRGVKPSPASDDLLVSKAS